MRGGVELTHNPDDGSPWSDIVDIRPIVNRRKPALYLLWGHGPPIEFEPVADSRGLPDDVATNLRQQVWKDSFGASYATLEELREVDWTSNTSGLDSIFWRSIPGKEQLGSPVHDTDSLDLSPNELEQLKTEGAVEYKNDRGNERIVRRIEPTRKRYCQTGGWWWIIDELMEHFTEWLYDPEGVRLVVWMTH